MRYITKEDLRPVIQERLLQESIQADDSILDKLEETAIGFAVSYMSGKYDTEAIFDKEKPLRNKVLVHVIASLTVYWAVRRNAARKVPEDYTDMYEKSEKTLEKIQAGSLQLPGLPEIGNGGDGQPGGMMFGNNQNRDYFI